MKWYGKYGRKLSWIVKKYGQYGIRMNWKVKWFGKYRRQVDWIVKLYGKYRRKEWKYGENIEEYIEMIWKIWKKGKLNSD